MGDFGSNLMLCIGTLYLLKFYTDELGMPAYYGGIIFLVAKFFTAFTDMLTGVLLTHAVILAQKESFGLYSVCVISGSSGCYCAILCHSLYFTR